MREVYMDHNATTPLHPEVISALGQAFDLFGNPSSGHRFGKKANKSIEEARATVARFINADPDEIVFTSGGSESNNLVLKGTTCDGFVCEALLRESGRHIITSQIEHPSVLNTLRCLAKAGYEITMVPVDSDGVIDPAEVEKAITPATTMITIMYGNNEVGSIQPIREIGALARESGVIFHTDAVQAVGKVPVDVKAENIDFLSLSAHKFNGPKGVGALFIRRGIHVCPLIHGGHQERGWRAGTYNTLGIVGLGKAVEVAERDMQSRNETFWALNDRLLAGIRDRIPHIRLNGPEDHARRLPSTVNVGFDYIEGESIMLRLDIKGVAVSTGSACSTGSLEPSHVLGAMGIKPELAHGSIRFSLGYGNTAEDVDYVLEVLPGIVESLRGMSPLYSCAKH